MPYAATVLVLVMISNNVMKSKMYTPMSLGKPFHSHS